ncbi:MAG: class I tRNA ligase family protein, partial [Kiritimatiellaeota bacterium]|nr:class I tRNA ligase family protein [Kiritimatiellota bacterium]
AHGWWLTGESKMSKSLGNVVNPMEMIERYGVDAFRYFLIAEMIMGQDASFTEEAFVRKFNADLANDLGNLLSRVVNMMGRYCAGQLPAPEAAAPAGAAEKALWDTVQVAVTAMERSVADLCLQHGIAETLSAVKAINRYFEIRQPWTQAKQPDLAPLGTTLYTAAEALRVAASLLYPIMPDKIAVVLRALGQTRTTPKLDELRLWGVLKPGAPVKDFGPLFPRVVAEGAPPGAGPAAAANGKQEPAAGSKAGDGSPPPAVPAPAELVNVDLFRQLDLRTAKIIAAERVAGATKLLKLDVLMGAERRQLVAGIALYYEPEALLGKTVVVVANLQPATIRGVASHGMILAASTGEQLRLVTLDGELSSGAKVK